MLRHDLVFLQLHLFKGTKELGKRYLLLIEPLPTPLPCAQGDKLQLQAGLDSDKIKTALSGTTKYKVLHFETMSGVFTNFTAEGAR